MSKIGFIGLGTMGTPMAAHLRNARAIGVSLPNTATAQELFNSCAARGGSGWDHSAMVRALENLADFEIGQQLK